MLLVRLTAPLRGRKGLVVGRTLGNLGDLVIRDLMAGVAPSDYL